MRQYSRPGQVRSGHFRYRWDPQEAQLVRIYGRTETGSYTRRRWLGPGRKPKVVRYPRVEA